MIRKNLIILGIIGIVLVSGCVGSRTCKECPPPSSWSECDENAEKTRTNYKCNEESLECESFTEIMDCQTILKAKAMSNDWTLVISPTLEKKVKGIITGKINDAPNSIDKISFLIFKEGSENPVAGIEDSDPSDGFSYSLDTTTLPNGLYRFSAVIFGEEGKPPRDGASIQIVIEN